MRYSQFPADADLCHEVAVETSRLCPSKPWSGQLAESMDPPGRRIDRIASPHVNPSFLTSNPSPCKALAPGISRRRRSFTTFLS
jgi:hypothetical protein